MIKTIKDFDLKGKKVIIRCDLNVPMISGEITDDNRIRKSLPTIRYALNEEAKVILLSHLGRLVTNADKQKYTLKPVAERLSKLLNTKVTFIDQTRGERVENKIRNMEPGEIVLLENTRFEDLDKRKESDNDVKLGKYWAKLGDIFINDAFGTAHRSHASNVGIAEHLPSGVGLLMEKELKYLNKANTRPKKPYAVILGGSKVSDKIEVINNLARKADYILIGGAMANTFLKAAGFSVGKSKIEEDKISYCRDMLDKYPDKLILPIDLVTGTTISDEAETHVRFINEVGTDEMGLDIGPGTIKVFKQYLDKCKTIVWNGPVGCFEVKKFAEGTRKLLEIITSTKAETILGGGDTASAAINMGFKDKITHISTGGGASLEMLEGKELPALKIIDEK